MFMRTMTRLLASATALALVATGPLAIARPSRVPPAASRPNAPNVVIWVMDDVGFGQLSAYGGLVDTPNIDRVARSGLLYTNYHTAPICSASRAALLTGRNPHTVHVGAHAAAPQPRPSHDGRIPPSAATLAANLRAAGYRTYAVGKWDHLPSEDVSPRGPFTYWPSGQGFDHFYGFLAADTDQFRPALWRDHAPVEPPHRAGYHLSADLADQAIRWIGAGGRDGSGRPFLLYWATGAVHAPHQAPEAFLRRYRGRFDRGWDWAREQILANQKARGLVPSELTLPPRPEGMPAWDSLSPDARRSYARAMEAFAAELSDADAQFGRMLDALKRSGRLDNTLIVITSDNGASAEGAENGTFNEHLYMQGRYPSVSENLRYFDAWGRPGTYPNYPVGWAVAGDTPFRYYKQTTYEGGVHVPLVVSWPGRIQGRNSRRAQFVYVTDLAPTILDAVRVPQAADVGGVRQSPFEGLSFTYSFHAPAAPAPARVQYVELWGDRAVYADGWKATAAERLKTWLQGGEPAASDMSWELYHLDQDPNEQTNLASIEPARLERMKGLFEREARLRGVLPLTTQSAARVYRRQEIERAFAARGGVWRYQGRVNRIPEVSMPPILGRDFRMTAVVDPRARRNGVVFSAGGRMGGVSLYLLSGRPVFAFRNADMTLTRIAAAAPIPPGRRRLVLEVRHSASGLDVRLGCDGKVLATGVVPGPATRLFSLTESFAIGSDGGTSPVADYDTPFAFDGSIGEVVFDFNGPAEPGAAAVHNW